MLQFYLLYFTLLIERPKLKSKQRHFNASLKRQLSLNAFLWPFWGRASRLLILASIGSAITLFGSPTKFRRGANRLTRKLANELARLTRLGKCPSLFKCLD